MCVLYPISRTPFPIHCFALLSCVSFMPRIELHMPIMHTYCNAIIAVTPQKTRIKRSMTTFRIVVFFGVKVMKYWLIAVITWRPGEVKSMGVRNRLVRNETR